MGPQAPDEVLGLDFHEKNWQAGDPVSQAFMYNVGGKQKPAFWYEDMTC